MRFGRYIVGLPSTDSGPHYNPSRQASVSPQDVSAKDEEEHNSDDDSE